MLFSRFAANPIQTVGTLPSGDGFAIESDFVYVMSTTGNLILRTTINLPGTTTQVSSDTTANGFLVAQPFVYWRTNDTTHLRRASWESSALETNDPNGRGASRASPVSL